jgi:hypothetical protein
MSWFTHRQLGLSFIKCVHNLTCCLTSCASFNSGNTASWLWGRKYEKIGCDTDTATQDFFSGPYTEHWILGWFAGDCCAMCAWGGKLDLSWRWWHILMDHLDYCQLPQICRYPNNGCRRFWKNSLWRRWDASELKGSNLKGDWRYGARKEREHSFLKLFFE